MIDRILHLLDFPLQDSVLCFMVILSIILLAPLVQRKTKIPGVITLIISGIIIGPKGLDIIEMNSAIEMFSTIGLLYILFLAGLELDADEFIRTKYRSILFGTLTFTLPLVIGFPVCHYILGYDYIPSFLTASMLSTHTLIAYTIVSKMDLTRNEAVAIAVGGTIITDMAVLIILALIIGVQEQSNGWTQWIYMALSFSLFFIFMFKIVPIVAKRFLRWFENESYSHYIFVLATVFLAAFLAEIAGLEPIIGAFATGLALNRLVPKTSSLMSRLEFSGNALFIPFFVISVGMIIDLDAILSGYETLWVAFFLTITSYFGKWLAAYITGNILNYSVSQRNLIFGLSSSHVAATLAVITVGYNIGIIDAHILNGTIILILISCVVSTLITERAARKVAIESSIDVAPVSTENKFLVAISNPATMTYLADFALNITPKKSPNPVYVLSVINEDHQVQQKLADARQTLEKLIKHGAKTEREIEVITTYDQSTASGIRRITKEIGATDLIMGLSLKSDFADVLFGSMMQRIMNSTNQILYFYRPLFPVFQHTSLQVICPHHSDKEYGFQNWLQKITLLAKNLNIKCYFHSNNSTIDAIKKTLDSNGTFKYNAMSNFASDVSNICIQLKHSDLLIFIMPRKGSVSAYPSEIKSMTDVMYDKNINSPFLVITPNHHNPITI